VVAASLHTFDICIKRPDEEHQPVGSLSRQLRPLEMVTVTRLTIAQSCMKPGF
jgi:hypothetical protein